MAPSNRKSATTAEVALVPLKNCLLNLPPSLVSLLVNANTPAQNVIVELQYRASSPGSSTPGAASSQRFAYTGWTGMPSKRRLTPVVGKNSIHGSRGMSRDQEIAMVEIDSTFGRVLGLNDGQKACVSVILHLDPPVAHTVNIEPLTPTDWEIIELHANFLELNLLSQIRALPNPSYSSSPSGQTEKTHPLTLHLSPTSTANIIITSLAPAAPSSSPFAKIAPDAEVIVAPKVRPKSTRPSRGESRSIASASRRSVGGRSISSTVRPRSRDSEFSSRGAVYLRGVDRKFASNWFDEDVQESNNEGFKVWAHRDVLAKYELRGAMYVCVSVVRPAGLLPPVDPQQQMQQKEQGPLEASEIMRKVVAKVYTWNESPDSNHVALSSILCSALGSECMVGEIVRIEVAPAQRSAIKAIRIFPFTSGLSKKNEGLKFGGESTAYREALVERIKAAYGNSGSDFGILGGPITNGMILPKLQNQVGFLDFDDAMILFDPPSDGKPALGWVLGSESKFALEIQPAIARPAESSLPSVPADETLPNDIPEMVGIDTVIENCMSNLTHCSSILVTGGLGSGKTSLCYVLGDQLRQDYLFNVSYFPCRKLVTDEARISMIKETLHRLFLSASWCARLCGQSIVILDDIDKLCPVETELQIGGENGRTRQISELVCSIVREFCSANSPVVLLATAQSKEALNNTIISSHVVREIVSLKAPDKEGRRRVLEKLTSEDKLPRGLPTSIDGYSHSRKASSQDSWLDPSNPATRPGSADEQDGFILSRDLDLLDLAGKTDGYMPGDLVPLVSRARNEALIREVQDTTSSSSTIILDTVDFEKALKGFTPASLRNVTLTASSTTFAAIGGLHDIRKTLLETLQYPTKYAPIFAQCPLRLRSGLLLYGFPGCGKTLLASAVAGECGLNFISVKGPEILNKYIGASEKSVRDLFERAEAARPCILFFDEFDSIAPKRGHDSTGVTDRVVNQLLTQMDGAEGLSGVYVLAATSRPDLIDPALLRPGRLDKSLLCDMPNHDDRVDILLALAKKLKLSEGVIERMSTIAKRTEGYSGADLQAVIYNAHLEAIHDALGDRTSDKRWSKSKPMANGINSPSSDLKTTRSFIQFLYDPDEHALATTTEHGRVSTTSPSLTPPAVIAAKLEALKKARRRQQEVQRGLSSNTSTVDSLDGIDGVSDDEKTSSDDIHIEWVHIERSLETTKSSISDVERKRLGAIYREFIEGRNGEMPTGEGAREIGGRTSLM
ncbi:Peroxisome biosynthesis protein pex1 [Emydomyces testavorans]|uniref:Peroxisomal ATPase PEX1 n=1 Tax=Emydomyces testavorans TaxID=2070801 RepID=A0AAF0DLV8_9EURO|nr:Peroxisome biosynthesis protein pex1 [Emydomyces testavorans]